MKILSLNPADGPQLTNFFDNLDQWYNCLLLLEGLPLPLIIPPLHIALEAS